MIKKVLIFLSLILICTNIFSADLYMYKFDSDVIYAIAIEKSIEFDDEYIVGLLEINPSGAEWWTISTHCYVDQSHKIISKVDLNFPTLEFNGAYLDACINSRNNVILQMEKVETITYKGCEIILPEVFDTD